MAKELSHSNCNTPQYNKELVLQANEKTEVVFDLWHRLVPGDGQRALNDGEEGRKWLLYVSLY